MAGCSWSCAGWGGRGGTGGRGRRGRAEPRTAGGRGRGGLQGLAEPRLAGRRRPGAPRGSPMISDSRPASATSRAGRSRSRPTGVSGASVDGGDRCVTGAAASAGAGAGAARRAARAARCRRPAASTVPKPAVDRRQPPPVVPPSKPPPRSVVPRRRVASTGSGSRTSSPARRVGCRPARPCRPARRRPGTARLGALGDGQRQAVVGLEPGGGQAGDVEDVGLAVWPRACRARWRTRRTGARGPAAMLGPSSPKKPGRRPCRPAPARAASL